MNFSLPELEKDALLTNLREANIRFHKVYPGDKPDRQPVHTVYGGANLFKSDTCIKMGEVEYTYLGDKQTGPKRRAR